MSPQEIQDAYAVVVQDIQNQTAQEAARIGNSQRSLGTLAERVASPSGQTSGLANYTYDRTMRPVVDSLTTSLTTAGKAAGLEELLKSKLRDAKRNYEDAKNNYTVASSGGGGGNNGNNDDPYDEEDYDQLDGGNTTANYIDAGTIVSVSENTLKSDRIKPYKHFDIYLADGKGGTEHYNVQAMDIDRARQNAVAQYNVRHNISVPTNTSGFGSQSGYSGGGGSAGGGGR